MRQLAFNFENEGSGRYEGNIVSIETDQESGTGREPSSGFFGLLKSKQNAIVESAAKPPEFARFRGTGRPMFLANTTPSGLVLSRPGA